MTDQLDAETTLVSAPGCTETLGVVTCALGTVPNGAVVTITIGDGCPRSDCLW
ncbi:MAG: hypothetical protein R2932_55375 [Caldilineaceae bacterium]